MGDAVAECGRHQTDLPVEALGQHDGEPVRRDFPGLAGQSHVAVDAHAFGHATQEIVGHRFVHRDQIFLFLAVFSAQQFIDDVAVAGQQNQTFGILVQSADRKDALLVIDEIDDVAFHALVGRAGDADRFVQRDIDVLAGAGLYIADTQGLAVDQDGIALLDPRAQRWLVAIDADPAFLDQRIGLAPGTEAGVGDEFVDTHRHRSIAAVKGMQGDVENQLAFRGISAR